jgi:hypothetical protein
MPDLPVADQRMLLNLWHSFIKSLSGLCVKKLRGLFLCNLQKFDMLKKQHFERKKSCVGLCNPPSGSLCLTFREMAECSHKQSARVTILNSNLPKPLADSSLDHQKVTTRESTQRTSDGD